MDSTRKPAVVPKATCLLLLLACAGPAFGQDKAPAMRGYDPDAIRIPPGYAVEAFATKLDFPVDIAFGDQGEIFVAEGGLHTYGIKNHKHAPPAQILRLLPNGTKEILYDKMVSLEEIKKHDSSNDMPEGIIPPITGITWHDGKLYVSHRSRYSVLDPQNGQFKTIVNGLPMWGEFLNAKPIFDSNGQMVFHVPTQGNSGVIEEHWMKVINLFNKPKAHEIPGENVELTGRNFAVPYEDPETPSVSDKKVTGVYVPLGVKTDPGHVVKGEKICNGAFYRCNPDGSNLGRIAWGFRSCFGYRFSPDGRLVCTQNSANPMAPRGLWYDFETIYEDVPGEWYGWPDFFSGIPITDARFEVHMGKGEFVLTDETHRRLLKGRSLPRQPLVRLPVHSAVEGLVFGRSDFGLNPNHILVAEFGTIVMQFKGKQLYPEGVQNPDVEKSSNRTKRAQAPGTPPPDVEFDWPGFKVQILDLTTGRTSDFLANKHPGPATAGTGMGLERPIQLEWGPDGALYVVDFGVISLKMDGMMAHPHTGAIWKVSRTDSRSTQRR